jgi:hypothetical protein
MIEWFGRVMNERIHECGEWRLNLPNALPRALANQGRQPHFPLSTGSFCVP